MSLKLIKASKQRRRERCKARTKAGHPCQAPAVEGGLCFCHAHPERLAELGRQGGLKKRRWEIEADVAYRPVKSIDEVCVVPVTALMAWPRFHSERAEPQGDKQMAAPADTRTPNMHRAN